MQETDLEKLIRLQSAIKEYQELANKYQITDVIKNGNDVYQEKNNLKDEYINNKIKETLIIIQ